MSAEPSYWSLDDFIDALVTLLRQRSYIVDNSIQVEDSWPGEEQQQSACIWVDEASSMEEVAGMRAGAINYNESYSVFVVCDVFKEGGTQKQALAGLTPLVGEVKRQVAEKKSLYGGTKIQAVRIAGWKYRPYVWRTGRGAACRIEIKVSGRR